MINKASLYIWPFSVDRLGRRWQKTHTKPFDRQLVVKKHRCHQKRCGCMGCAVVQQAIYKSPELHVGVKFVSSLKCLTITQISSGLKKI